MNILKTKNMDKIKYSNLLNKDGKHKYWAIYKSIKRSSVVKNTIFKNLTFEQFCRDFAKNFKLSELNGKLIKK